MIITAEVIMAGVQVGAELAAQGMALYERYKKLGEAEGLEVPTIEELRAKNKSLQDRIDAELRKRGIDPESI